MCGPPLHACAHPGSRRRGPQQRAHHLRLGAGWHLDLRRAAGQCVQQHLRPCHPASGGGHAGHLRKRQPRLGAGARRQHRACAAPGRHRPRAGLAGTAEQGRLGARGAGVLPWSAVGREPVGVAASNSQHAARPAWRGLARLGQPGGLRSSAGGPRRSARRSPLPAGQGGQQRFLRTHRPCRRSRWCLRRPPGGAGGIVDAPAGARPIRDGEPGAARQQPEAAGAGRVPHRATAGLREPGAACT